MIIRHYNSVLKTIENERAKILKGLSKEEEELSYEKINQYVQILKQECAEYNKISVEQLREERKKSITQEEFNDVTIKLENKIYYNENESIIMALPTEFKTQKDLFELRKLYERSADKRAFKVAIVGGVALLIIGGAFGVKHLTNKNKQREEITTEATSENKTKEDLSNKEEMTTEHTTMSQTEEITTEENIDKDTSIEDLFNKWKKDTNTTENSNAENKSNMNISNDTNNKNNMNNTNDASTTNTDNTKNNSDKKNNKDNENTKNKTNKKDNKKSTTSDSKREESESTATEQATTRTTTVIVPETTTEAPKIIESTEAEVITTEVNEEEIRKLFEKTTQEKEVETKKEEKTNNNYKIDDEDINYHSEALEIKSKKSGAKVLVYFNA